MDTATEIVTAVEQEIADHRQEILTNAERSGLSASDVNRKFDQLLKLPTDQSWADKDELRRQYASDLETLRMLKAGPIAAGGMSGPIKTAGGLGVTFDYASDQRTGNVTGVLIGEIKPGSPASAAGLKAGDEIQAVGNVILSEAGVGAKTVFRTTLLKFGAGETVRLTVRRPGVSDEPYFVDVVLKEGFGNQEHKYIPAYGIWGSPPLPGQAGAGQPGGPGGTPDPNAAPVVVPDTSKVSLENIVGTTYPWRKDNGPQWYTPLLFGAPMLIRNERDIKKDVQWEFIQKTNGTETPSSIVGDGGTALQVKEPSKLLTEYALVRNDDGTMVKYAPPSSTWPALGVDFTDVRRDPWANVVIYQVGFEARAKTGSLASPGRKIQLKTDVMNEVKTFLETPSMGDFFPIYIVEPSSSTGASVNSTTYLKPKVLYIPRDKLTEYVEGLK